MIPTDLSQWWERLRDELPPEGQSCLQLYFYRGADAAGGSIRFLCPPDRAMPFVDLVWQQISGALPEGDVVKGALCRMAFYYGVCAAFCLAHDRGEIASLSREVSAFRRDLRAREAGLN